MSQRDNVEFMRLTAENYERYFAPSIGAPVAADVIKAASRRPGERVLDACGTGVVTKLAPGRVAPDDAVSGLDLNPAMLAGARATARSDVSIDWHEAPAEDLPSHDARFDAVLCGTGLQFFSDSQASPREFHRVFVPGGRVVATVLGPTPPPLQIMADALPHHTGPESASFVHAVFSLHDPDDLGPLRRMPHSKTSSSTPPKCLELSPPAEFLWRYIGSTPLAAVLAGAAENAAPRSRTNCRRSARALAPRGSLVGVVQITS
jgi:ubiquinone/menaquinone biosynthesis C-methylase UbiE